MAPKFFTLLLCFAIFFSIASSKECPVKKPVFCYWASWSIYRTGDGKHSINNIFPEYCTHIVYTFSGINLSGYIDSLDFQNDITDGGYKNFANLREKYPCTKFLLAIGGWNEGSEKYSLVADNEKSRETFADKVIWYLVYFGFDGIDVDWEYPGQRGGIAQDKQNFVALLEALKRRLAPRKKLVTVAVGAAQYLLNSSYDPKGICATVDFVSVMGYDFQDPTKTSIHSPLKSESNQNGYTIDDAVNYFLKNGCPSSKILLGVPAYGRSYMLKDGNKAGLGLEVAGPGKAGPYTREKSFLGFNEICEMQKSQSGWKQTYMEKNAAVYAWNPNSKLWVSYDDQKTIQWKAQYVLEKKLGGMMLWSIDTDDFLGKCYQQVYPLLTAINRGLKNPLRLRNKVNRI